MPEKAFTEDWLRTFFENAIVGIFQTTPDGRFLMLNRSAAAALGYPDPETAMRDITDLARQAYADPSQRDEYLDTIRRDGYVSNWMSLMRRRDGSLMWNVENARGVFDDDGALLYVEGTIKDVTEEVEARKALRESELRALKLQFKPHFLFNTLNMVAMMIRAGEHAKALEAVNMLGDMFRYYLEFEGENTVALAQELSFVDIFLELQKLRFEDGLSVHRDVDPATLGCRVPTLILQPIVENAVKHGMSGRSGRCRVDIVTRLDGGRLSIGVVNDFSPGPAGTGDHGYGIGISNTRARLHESYGPDAGFGLEEVDGRMKATLEIPLEEARP